MIDRPTQTNLYGEHIRNKNTPKQHTAQVEAQQNLSLPLKRLLSGGSHHSSYFTGYVQSL